MNLQDIFISAYQKYHTTRQHKNLTFYFIITELQNIQ